VNTGFANDLNFSGVGRAPNGRWGTLIGPAHFLSAKHFTPSGSLTFQDHGGQAITCEIIAGKGVAETDIWVGALNPDSCDLTGITTYNVATRVIDPGTVVYQVGVTNATTMRVGRNRLSYVSHETIEDLGTGAWANFLDDSVAGDEFGVPMATALDLNPDETYYIGGDSGAPSFVADASGNMQLIGVHSYNGSTSDENFDGIADEGLDPMGKPILVRRISGDAYLPAHTSAIDATLAAVAVPEPSPVMCLGLLAGIYALWSTRRSSSC
jgi:hypothetical protein